MPTIQLLSLMVILLLGISNEAVATNHESNLCDMLAAHPLDPRKPPHIYGVEFDKIVASEAITACRSALDDDPQNLRLSYQFGRSLVAGGNREEGYRLVRSAAENGYPSAQLLLSILLVEDGDFIEGFNWSERALNSRESQDGKFEVAAFEHGEFYRLGHGVELSKQKAFEFYLQSAEGGFIRAAAAVSASYRMGFGVAKNIDKAETWEVKVLRSAPLVGAYYLGEWLLRESVDSETRNHAIWLLTNASERGSSDSAHYLGTFLFGMALKENSINEKEIEDGLNYIKTAVKLGSEIAELELTRAYFKALLLSRHVEKKVFLSESFIEKLSSEASDWFRGVDQQEDSTTQLVLGHVYRNGLVAKPDIIVASRHYCKSAKLGSKKAMKILQKIRSESYYLSVDDYCGDLN